MFPEFQINNKLVGKAILAYAKKGGTVSDDQRGSHKGHAAINTGLSKKLLFDLFRKKRPAAALAMNDMMPRAAMIESPIQVLCLFL